MLPRRVPQNSPPMRYRKYVQANYGSTENGAQASVTTFNDRID